MYYVVGPSWSAIPPMLSGRCHVSTLVCLHVSSPFDPSPVKPLCPSPVPGLSPVLHWCQKPLPSPGEAGAGRTRRASRKLKGRCPWQRADPRQAAPRRRAHESDGLERERASEEGECERRAERGIFMKDAASQPWAASSESAGHAPSDPTRCDKGARASKQWERVRGGPRHEPQDAVCTECGVGLITTCC